MSQSARTLLTVKVPSRDRHYDIEIGPGLFSILPNWLRAQSPKPQKIAVISDTQVAPLYADPLTHHLIEAGFDVTHYNVPSGELAKSMKSAQDIFDLLVSARFSRHDFLLAVGGGVVGDLVGFCASAYQRGMRWVQVPTTLLAQVDSSVGGKVAVNFGGLKNVIGAFYQPDLVVSDLETLETLPERDYRAGLAEVVKYALLERTATVSDGSDVLLFDYLSQNVDAINRKDARVLGWIVHRCCDLKAAVVAADETDTTGHRAILNLGHTFGHAYESASDYAILHGEAVSIGMKKACDLAVSLGDLASEAADAVAILMQRLNLPLSPEGFGSEKFSPERLLDWMRQDKKNQQSKITLILPDQRIGSVRLRRDVSDEQILAVLS
ncbi:MAG: 3-dehydroquinate synthase [Vampirovibrionales bacterium]|nr:3-dehydroquinate synthase [Vampirovibrionales bacterium]